MEDGLNIYQLANQIIRGKFIIIFLTLIVTICGYYYIQTRQSSITVTIPIVNINDTEVSKFAALNKIASLKSIETEDVNNFVPYDYTYIFPKGEFIGKKKLLNSFVNEFNTYEALRTQIGNFFPDFNIEKIIKYSRNFELVSKIVNDDTLFFLKIYTDEKNIDSDISIIVDTLIQINTNVLNNLTNELEYYRKAMEFDIERKILELQDQIDIKTSEFVLDLENELTNLNYHYAIAQNLNLKNLNLENIDFLMKDKGQNMKYLLGTEILKQQISLVNQKLNDTVNSLPKDIQLLNIKLINLKRKNEIKILNNAIEKAPLNDLEYMSVQYDISGAEYRIKKGILENTYIFFLAGLFLSCTIVLFVSGYRKHFNLS
tara:strand:- start:107 stop:1225 length:1119 start_codon:yes stop_codon:yes gene_type:complete